MAHEHTTRGWHQDRNLVSKQVHELEYWQKFYCIPGVSLDQLRAVHDSIEGDVTNEEFKAALDAAGYIHHDPEPTENTDTNE